MIALGHRQFHVGSILIFKNSLKNGIKSKENQGNIFSKNEMKRNEKPSERAHV